jgi:predicted phage terminase large subunit-like protein
VTDFDHIVAAARRRRKDALRELDMIDAQTSLVAFIRLMWPVLEPGRKFVEGWAVSAICEHLEAVSRGEIRKLLINVPPGCMKSLTTNVFWPAWEWGPRDRADLRYVSASYSQALTIRDNRKCRNLITSELYQQLWGSRFRLDEGQNAKVRFDTNKTGFKVATSVEGMGTGERGDRFIIDDPHNVKEGESELKRNGALQWFTEVVPTRINDAQKSAIVVIMQRVHEQDVSGLILAHKLGFEHLCLPMEHERERTCVTKIGFKDPRKEESELLWPERFSRKYLEEELKPQMRAIGGSYAEAGQLQQRPVPRGGGMFKKEHFQYVDALPAGCDLVRGWDLAATKDGHAAYTVGVKIGRDRDGKTYIADIERLRGSPMEVERSIQGCAARDGVQVRISIPQDPGQAGKSQKAYLASKLNGYDVHFSPETGSKEDRAKPLAAQAEAGNMFLVRAPWNDAFVAEATMFPNSTFKDQVDAASRAYAMLNESKPQEVGFSPMLFTSESVYGG